MVLKPHLNESCCGCSVETGSKIIAWILVISQPFSIISLFVQYSQIKDGKNFIHKESVLAGIMGKLVLSIIYLIFDILLIIGIYKRRPSFILAWIILGLFGIIIAGIFFIILAFAEPFVLIPGAIVLAIGYYFLLVVNGHYTNLKSGQAGTTSYGG